MEIIKFNDFISGNYKSTEDIKREEDIKKILELALWVFILLSLSDFVTVFQKVFVGLDLGIVQDAFLYLR